MISFEFQFTYKCCYTCINMSITVRWNSFFDSLFSVDSYKSEVSPLIPRHCSSCIGSYECNGILPFGASFRRFTAASSRVCSCSCSAPASSHTVRDGRFKVLFSPTTSLMLLSCFSLEKNPPKQVARRVEELPIEKTGGFLVLRGNR